MAIGDSTDIIGAVYILYVLQDDRFARMCSSSTSYLHMWAFWEIELQIRRLHSIFAAFHSKMMVTYSMLHPDVVGGQVASFFSTQLPST